MLPRVPKGKLILIGGAEDKGDVGRADIATRNRNYVQFEILQHLIPERQVRGRKTIEIITTASSIPEEVAQTYRVAYRKIGFKYVGSLNIANKTEADNPEFVERIQKAHAVFFSGGDQFRLSTILGDSDVLNAIHQRYWTDKNFVVGGTSAGAMCAGVLMMYEGESNEALLNGAVKISSGLGFMDHCLIDTHFIKRGRFGRLAQAVVMNPSCIGIGLGEDTALIVEKGNKMKCKGSGMVVIIDGKDVQHTNIAYAEADTPVCIENLRVHILAAGNGYILEERKFVPAKKDLEKENASRPVKKKKSKKK
jgi:cyanophycinase